MALGALTALISTRSASRGYPAEAQKAQLVQRHPICLPPFVKQCQSILEAYPIRGPRWVMPRSDGEVVIGDGVDVVLIIIGRGPPF
jgi:hypothetical protein